MNLRFLALLVAVCASYPAKAADAEVEKLLSRMREAYSSAKTARIIVKTTGQRFGKDAVTTEITYMKERKIFSKISGTSSFNNRVRTFISDGQKVSMDDLSGNQQTSKFDLDFIPFPVNLEVMAFWDWKRQLSTTPGSNMHESVMRLKKDVGWNGKSWLLLEETANGQGVYVDYYIDPKTAFIHRVKVFDLKKQQLRTEFIVSKLELNVKVDPKLFTVKSGRYKVEKKIDF